MAKVAGERHSRRRNNLCKGPEAKEHVIAGESTETEMRQMTGREEWGNG